MLGMSRGTGVANVVVLVSKEFYCVVALDKLRSIVKGSLSGFQILKISVIAPTVSKEKMPERRRRPYALHLQEKWDLEESYRA